MITIKTGKLDHPQLQNLIRQHWQQQYQRPATGDELTAQLAKLAAPDMRVYSAWHRQRLAGMVAIKQLDERTCALESLRTATAFLRQGVATDLLRVVLPEAKGLGFRHIQTQAGRAEHYGPARALLSQFGFRQHQQTWQRQLAA